MVYGYPRRLKACGRASRLAGRKGQARAPVGVRPVPPDGVGGRERQTGGSGEGEHWPPGSPGAGGGERGGSGTGSLCNLGRDRPGAGGGTVRGRGAAGAPAGTAWGTSRPARAAGGTLRNRREGQRRRQAADSSDGYARSISSDVGCSPTGYEAVYARELPLSGSLARPLRLNRGQHARHESHPSIGLTGPTRAVA